MIETAASNTQNNVSLEDEISPGGIMTVSKDCIREEVRFTPILRHAIIRYQFRQTSSAKAQLTDQGPQLAASQSDQGERPHG